MNSLDEDVKRRNQSEHDQLEAAKLNYAHRCELEEITIRDQLEAEALLIMMRSDCRIRQEDRSILGSIKLGIKIPTIRPHNFIHGLARGYGYHL